MIQDKNQNLASLCQRHRLDYPSILLHRQRIESAIAGRHSVTLKIIDTCRIENGGVLPCDWVSVTSPDLNGFVAFVPAAGASSRYFQIFADFIAALATGSAEKIFEAIQHLKNQDLSHWALFKEFKAALNFKTVAELTCKKIEHLRELFSLPKALVPCAVEGHTFLKLKVMEHQAMPYLDGQVFVAGLTKRGLFETALENEDRGLERNWKIYTQGPNESTLRFNDDLSPVVDQTGDLAIVPAGHGTLAALIPSVENDFPGAHSVFIRNVDNVMGTSKKTLSAVENFLKQHKYLLLEIRNIRQFLGQNNLQNAANTAQQLLQALKHPVNAPPEITKSLEKLPGNEVFLWKLQYQLFHYREPLSRLLANSPSERVAKLVELFDRPVNSLGQVPNTAHDVGGTPVFVDIDHSEVKICLEVPHASAADRELFLQNPKKATHFNPVFAAAEIRPLPSACYQANFPFWILTERHYQGKKVYYHESVLYELLGNSLLANVVFVEVPRTIFNPHKSVKDTANRKIAHWLSS